jgi:molybdopterin-guanine dinucleotide biosynthesis protein A
MGRDKAQIPWQQGTLLTNAIGRLREVAANVFLVGDARLPEALAPVVLDAVPGSGPLAGIQAALQQSATIWNLIVAVDMPLLTADLLEFIFHEARGDDYVAVVPRVGGRLQPLCAAYHRDLLGQVQGALAARELSIHRLLEGLQTGAKSQTPGKMYVIEEEQLRANGLRPEMLLNVNTPEDLERARLLAATLNVK